MRAVFELYEMMKIAVKIVQRNCLKEDKNTAILKNKKMRE